MAFVLYALLAIVVAGVLFLIAARFLPAGEQIAPPLRDEPPWELPAQRALQPDDVDSVRLPVALRGYRFAETDLLLDRLAAELRDRDAEIARLRGWSRSDDVSDEREATDDDGAELAFQYSIADADVDERDDASASIDPDQDPGADPETDEYGRR